MGEDSEADQIDCLSEEDRRGEKKIKPRKPSEIRGPSRENEKKIDNPDDVGTLFGFF